MIARADVTISRLLQKKLHVFLGDGAAQRKSQLAIMCRHRHTTTRFISRSYNIE